jgi:hypothetical protein
LNMIFSKYIIKQANFASSKAHHHSDRSSKSTIRLLFCFLKLRFLNWFKHQ